MSTVLNIALAAVLAMAALGGLRRGLRRELVNIAGLVASLAGGILLAKPVSSLVSRWGVIEEVPYLLAFVIGFILVSFGFSLLKGPFLPKEIDTAERISGAALGLAKGMLFAALLFYALVGIWPRLSEQAGDAVMVRIVLPGTVMVDALTEAITPLLPEELTAQIRSGFAFFRETREQLSESLESLGEASDTIQEYGRKVQESAAVADSVLGALEPPP